MALALFAWAFDEKRQTVLHVSDSAAHEGNVLCLNCKEWVVPRQGEKNAALFMHKSQTDCNGGSRPLRRVWGGAVASGESNEQKAAKYILLAALPKWTFQSETCRRCKTTAAFEPFCFLISDQFVVDMKIPDCVNRVDIGVLRQGKAYAAVNVCLFAKKPEDLKSRHLRAALSNRFYQVTAEDVLAQRGNAEACITTHHSDFVCARCAEEATRQAAVERKWQEQKQEAEARESALDRQRQAEHRRQHQRQQEQEQKLEQEKQETRRLQIQKAKTESNTEPSVPKTKCISTVHETKGQDVEPSRVCPRCGGELRHCSEFDLFQCDLCKLTCSQAVVANDNKFQELHLAYHPC